MKVGILTFHNAHNYGAVLQAFALKKKIAELGHDTEIINYQNKELKQKYAYKLSIHYNVRDFLSVQRIKKKAREKKMLPCIQDTWERQWNRFERFIDDVLLNHKKIEYRLKELEGEDWDCLVVGSDQVWTGWITGGLDPVYLLDFSTKAKKISYAASLFKGEFRKAEERTFKRCLSKFNHISVRETKLEESIKRQLGLKAVTVLDPTLLLNREDYLPLVSETALMQEKYVFAYFVSESTALLNSARKAAQYLGLELIELHYYKHDLENENYIADAGPNEFLWYIQNAEYVITDSFHGTIFSIIFQKNFYSIYDKDARKDSLLEALDLKNRHKRIIDRGDMENNVDYSNVEKKLIHYRKSSIEFLEKAIGKKG